MILRGSLWAATPSSSSYSPWSSLDFAARASPRRDNSNFLHRNVLTRDFDEEADAGLGSMPNEVNLKQIELQLAMQGKA